MVKKKVKTGTASGSDPGNNSVINTAQEQTSLSSPMVVNGNGVEVPSESKVEDTNTITGGINVEVASESKSEDKITSTEQMDEENVILVMKNGEVSVEEEETEKDAIEVENKDEGADEPISKEEDDELITGEEDNGPISEEEADEQNETAEEKEAGEEKDEDVEEGQEEGGDLEEELRDTAEEAGKEEGINEKVNVEEAPTVTKAEETAGANPREMVKRFNVRSRLEKVAAKGENKSGMSSKKKVASATVENPGAADKQKLDSTVKDKLKASGKKKVAATMEDKPEASSKEKATTTTEDKPAGSSRKNLSKRVKSMGLIFMCNSKTKDCYRYKVLGLPAGKKDIVQNVYKGMRLFLFDIDLRVMYGIYKAAGPGGYNIQPKAFDSAFPSQVRFTVLKDCLPLAEEKFKKVIQDNYHAKKKFNCQLNLEQVKNLCKLFSASSKAPELKKQPKMIATGTPRGVDRRRVR